MMVIEHLLMKKYKAIPGERFFSEAFVSKEYSLIDDKRADVVVDIGALAGEFSSYIYNEANTIYAIEPHYSAYKELTGNIEEFNLGKIRPFNLAIAGTSGKRNLLTSGERGGWSLVPLGQETDSVSIPVQVVETKTLAKFMEDERIDHIDILKIDIEGTELEVFNSEDFGTVAHKIDVIIGEHLWECEDLFKSLGYTMAPITGLTVMFERTNNA